MTTVLREPPAQVPAAERTSEARRRADRQRGTWRAPQRENERQPEPEAASRRTDYDLERMPVTPPNGEAEAAAPGAEGVQLPPAPEPGVTAEQVAAREEQAAAARAALENAQDSPGLMTAFAQAPPTVKAQVSGELGSRLSSAMAQETQAVQEHTPEIQAEMAPNTPPPAGEIPAPPAGEIVLEPAAPAAAPNAESLVGEAIANPADHTANAQVVGSLRSSFNPESGAAAVNTALNSVDTTNPGIAASPGTAPPVPQTGETNPQRFENQLAEGARQSQAVLAQQQQAAAALPGAERVQLAEVHESLPVGELPSPTAEQAPAPEGAQQYLQMNMPADVQTAFDDIAGEQMQQSQANAQSQMQQAAEQRDQQHQAEVDRAQQQTAEAQRQADADQRSQVANTRQQIEQQRQSTREQQQAAAADVHQQSETRRQADRSQFDERVSADQQQIDNRYDQAERDAQAEVQHGEQQAEAERRRSEQEAEDQSWWEAALDFVTSLFNALVAAINSIFDAVRAAVNAILNAVRDFALRLIDLAAGFLRSLVEAFGQFLKSLVQAVLANIFPGLARALMNFIDQAVALATRLINAVAQALRSAVNAIVEALRAGINAILNAYQAAVNAALALARAAITGDWGAFIMQLIEAACRVAGIDPQQIYAFIGRAQETIRIIIDNPGQFLSNVVEALAGGFRRFGENFLTHLQAGIIGWLTGALGSTGIQLPERFDLMGVISLVAQILGLAWQNLRQRLVRLVGERGVQVIEFVAGYVQTLIEGGWAGLWERIQNDLSTLRDLVLQGIRDFLVERVIMAAITRLATMFNPVGALVNILIAVYNFYTFIRDQVQRIAQVVGTVVEAIGNIARGVLGAAQERIESLLASLLPLAIDLLARLIGLGNVGERVRAILQRVQDMIWGAIDRLVSRVVGMFRGGGAAAQPAGAGAAPGAAAGAAQIGETINFQAEHESHRLFITTNGRQANIMIASENPRPLANLLSNWQESLSTLESHQQRQAQVWITELRSMLTETDSEADMMAVARFESRERTPANRDREVEIQRRQASLTDHERNITSRLQQLFPLFVDDTRAVANRFEQALSFREFQNLLNTQTWQSKFGGTLRLAQYDFEWGRQNNRLESVDGREYRLSLSDNDLVPLAARVITARGRLSTLLGRGRPYFLAEDVRNFCASTRTERLPNGPERYPDAVISRIVQLLQQREEIIQDTSEPTQFVFAEIPDRRLIPNSWDSDKYRRSFYLNRSSYDSERRKIIDENFGRISTALNNLASSNSRLKSQGSRYWAQLIQREAVYDKDFEDYSEQEKDAFKVKSNWSVDHFTPLAEHWSIGSPAGNNTTEERRHDIAGNPQYLRIMWGPKNSQRQARGATYTEFVMRGFTSLITRSKGPAYVDYDEKFTNYRPRS